MKCLQRYQWVKLPRNALPTGKGLMGDWMKLASRAAFRKGVASYCGYENAVEPGMWAGGVVGLKSILGVRSRVKALETLGKLAQLGYLTYELDKQTKKADLPNHRLGREVFRQRVHGWSGLHHGWVRFPLPTKEHHRALSSAAPHI